MKTKDTLKLHFKEKNGRTIKTYSTASNKEKLTVSPGGNQFVWNTRYEGQKH